MRNCGRTTKQIRRVVGREGNREDSDLVDSEKELLVDSLSKAPGDGLAKMHCCTWVSEYICSSCESWGAGVRRSDELSTSYVMPLELLRLLSLSLCLLSFLVFLFDFD